MKILDFNWFNFIELQRQPTVTGTRPSVVVDSHLRCTTAFALGINSDDSAAIDRPSHVSWSEIEQNTEEVRASYGRNDFHVFVQDRDRVLRRLKQMVTSIESTPSIEVRLQVEGLKVPLKRYQKYGVAWMRWRESQDPRGGILADDMGTGKTIVLIGLLLATRSVTIPRTLNATLIVCPPDLINQWQNELETKISIPLRLAVHHGNSKVKTFQALKEFDVILISYNNLAAEIQSGSFFADVKWKRVVLDEAHFIKNSNSQRSQAAVATKAHYKWAITGTPLHNRTEDLSPLLSFLRVDPFNDPIVSVNNRLFFMNNFFKKYLKRKKS